MNPDPDSPQMPAGRLSAALPGPEALTERSSLAAGTTIPWRAVLTIVASVFVGEASVMFAMSWTQVTSPFHELMDALLISVLCLVLLQRYVLRPLQQEVRERRRVEAELRIQTAALHAAANGVLITDRGGRIYWANPAFFAMTGYSPEEILGKTPRILKSGHHDDALYAGLWQTIQAGDVWRGEMTNRRKDGTLYTEEQTITPVHDEAGQVAYFVAIKMDCTQRKEAEAQLAQRNQELQALSQAEHHQRQFAEALAQATHALNTSLFLEEVLDRILEQTQTIVPCRAAAVLLLRDNWVDVPRHRNVADAVVAFPQGFSLDVFPEFRTIAAGQTPVMFEDAAMERARTMIPGLEWIRSAGAAPLIEGNRVTGFLTVMSEQADFFSQETLASLMAFTAHAAAALQNARLYRAERHARRTAETLSAASLDLTRTLRLQAVLDSLLRHLGLLVAFDGAHIALFDDQGALTLQAAAADDPWAAPDQAGAAIDVDNCPVLQSLVYEQQSRIVSEPALVAGSAYFAALAPRQSWLGVPIVVGDHAVGVCGLAKHEPGFFTTEHVRLTEVMVAQAAVAVQNALLFQQVQSGRERLQSLSRRLVQVQENERRHVARELHDEASQALTSLKFGLRQLGQHGASPEALVEAVAGLCDVTDTVLEDLHRLAMDLRPASLDHLGLVVALRDHLAKLNRQHWIQARLEAIGFDQERLPPDLETALYRITQEALTNVVRHARATQVDLLLHLYEDTVRLTIEDNGVGFDPAALAMPGQLGLVGMRERCEMLDGRLTVESAPGCGTTLVVEIPRHDSHSDC